MKQETLNDRLDRIESEIKSLSDKINQIKPADINKKQVAELVDDLSAQVKSIKPGISEDQVKSMLSDFKPAIPKSGINKEYINEMITDAISKIKPQQFDITKEINDVIERDITKEFITGLYRGK